jgi:arylsulfatase A-like enzyme
MAGQYAIPLLFYTPGDSLTGRKKFTIQQSDILPTVLDYLRYNKAFVAFGNSALRPGLPRMAFQCAHDTYTLTRGNYTLVFDGDKAVSLFNTREDPWQKDNLINKEKQLALELETFMKAALQQYNHRMINNKLFP